MKTYNLSLNLRALCCSALVLCIGLVSCDDDDAAKEGQYYNYASIAYDFAPAAHNGVTTEWQEFSVDLDNPSDTVMVVDYNPCAALYNETTFIPDDPSTFDLNLVNFGDTLWVSDIEVHNGEPVALVSPEVAYLPEPFRSAPNWDNLPDERLEVQPHSSVFYNGYIRIDRIVATYTIRLKDAVSSAAKEVTGTVIKTGPTAWRWGEQNPYPGD